jgi:hypothetical protein
MRARRAAGKAGAPGDQAAVRPRAAVPRKGLSIEVGPVIPSRAGSEAAPVIMQAWPSRLRSTAVERAGAVSRAAAGSAATSQSEVEQLLEAGRRAHEAAIATGRTMRLVMDFAPSGSVVVLPPEVTDDAGNADFETALSEARTRGDVATAKILSSPDMLSADEFAAEIGMTRAGLHKVRARHEVLGLEGAKRGIRFPRWQLVDGHLLPGLKQIFEVLSDGPWTVYRFLQQKHPELGGASALDALKRGQVEAVRQLAEAIGHGAFS